MAHSRWSQILCIATVVTLLLCCGFATSFSTDHPLLQQYEDRVGRLPGPGCSSIAFGQAEEIGPFHIKPDGNTLHLNPYSWNRVANIIFLDTPVGVGFSYSNNESDLMNNGDKRTAEDNLVFLLKWFERFPQYKRSDFFISGESYAGHYVPQLSQVIVKYNSATKENAINLKGFMVGNALTDDFHDQLGMFEFMWSSGLISDQTYKLLNILCDFQSVEHPSDACEKIWEIADKELGNIDPYSLFTPPCHANVSQLSQLIIIDDCYVMLQRIGRLREEYDPCTENHSIVYFNRPEVQTILHVDPDHKPATWETCRDRNPLILILCSEVVNTNWKDSPRSVLNIYHELIHMGLRIWVFSTDSPRHRPSRSRQRLSRVDLGRDNPAWSRLSADRRYRVPIIKVLLVQSLWLQSVSALGVLMAIAKGLSVATPRIYTIATSSVGRDYVQADFRFSFNNR
ncbi:Serine carboxypeptidase II-2, partial [Mucuna pruriens]